MQQTLRMVFRNAEGRVVSVNFADPQPELNEINLEMVMDSIITKNIFFTTGGDNASKVRAEVVSRDVDVISEF